MLYLLSRVHLIEPRVLEKCFSKAQKKHIRSANGKKEEEDSILAFKGDKVYTSFVNKRIYYLTNARGIHIKSSQRKLSGELYLFVREEGEMGFVQRSHRTVLKLIFDYSSSGLAPQKKTRPKRSRFVGILRW